MWNVNMIKFFTNIVDTFLLAGVATGLGGGGASDDTVPSPGVSSPPPATPSWLWETFTHLTDFILSSQSGICTV